MDFSLAHRETLVSKWLWLNMNGNIIYHIPFTTQRSYGIHIQKRRQYFWKLEGILMMISCPQLSTSLSLSFRLHPVISLVMWEWWSRDNGMLSFHMRQEDSLQALTCFSTGERNASCYLHIPASQQLSVLHFLFIISSIFWFSLVPGQRLTELSQASLSITLRPVSVGEVVHCGFRQIHLFAVAAMH